MPQAKTEKLVRDLMSEIAAGKHGRRGDLFMTVRELCAVKQVSLKTAFRALSRLKEEGILEKSGRYHRLAPILPMSREAGKPMLIGFLATCLESPYFAQLAVHAEEFAHAAGASLIIASSNYDFDKECERLQLFCRQGVAGILICPWAATARQEAFYKTLPAPYVMVGRKLESADCDAVLVDNAKASRAMAHHLIAAGAQEFVYIGQSGKSSDQRLSGFRGGLAENGFALPEENILRLNYQQRESSRAAIRRQLEKKRVARLGIFCYHDLFAMRTVNLCHELAIRIPEEAAVAGFDDLAVAAENWPPLTSVSYPVRDMARLALEALYTRIKFKTGGGGVCRYLEPKIIVRASTRPADKLKSQEK